MAKMTIDIINPTIDLIKGLTSTVNSCLTVYTFDIQSSPNAFIKVFLERINNEPEDYSYAQIKHEGRWSQYTSGTGYTLDSTGSTQFRVVIRNAYLMNLSSTSTTDDEGNEVISSETEDEVCAMTQVTVADITNSLSEETVLTRCNSDANCMLFEDPIAYDDEFTVNGGETKTLDILANDDGRSSLVALRINLTSNPTEGTISVENDKVVYVHTGLTNTIDTFTYQAINDEGGISNTATVEVTIPFEGDSSTLTFYPLTQHSEGESGKTGNRYDLSVIDGYTPPDGVLLERKQADGTIRETGFADNVYITPSFLEGDTVASTVPLDKIKTFSGRYHNIKSLLFTPSADAPNLEYLKLRGNWANLGNLDLTNNTKLYYLDISKNYIDSISLPVTDANDTNNYFTFAYLGDYTNNAPAPRQVVNTLMRRAFYSNVSDATTTGVETKRFNSASSVGSLYYDSVNYHKLLIDKGWSIEHISTVESVTFPSTVIVHTTTETASNISTGITMDGNGGVTGTGSYDLAVDLPIDTHIALKEDYYKSSSSDYPSGSFEFKYPDGYVKVKFTISAANGAGDLYVDGVLVNDNFTTYANYSRKDYVWDIMKDGKVLGQTVDQPITITRTRTRDYDVIESGLKYYNNYSFEAQATLDFMTSHHNWELEIPSGISWLSTDNLSGVASNVVQSINLTAQPNDTGASRSTPVYLKKIKEYPRTTSNAAEDGTEYHYKATINITQP